MTFLAEDSWEALRGKAPNTLITLSMKLNLLGDPVCRRALFRAAFRSWYILDVFLCAALATDIE